MTFSKLHPRPRGLAGRPLSREVQASIQDKLPIYTAVVPLERAQGIPGLRAVFGERYPDPVRVIAVGNATVEKLLEAAEDGQELDPSVELCGGTHLRTNNTAEAEAFALVQEEAVAKGIRRIVALTGAAAKDAIAEGAALEAQVSWSGVEKKAEREYTLTGRHVHPPTQGFKTRTPSLKVLS